MSIQLLSSVKSLLLAGETEQAYRALESLPRHKQISFSEYASAEAAKTALSTNPEILTSVESAVSAAKKYNQTGIIYGSSVMLWETVIRKASREDGVGLYVNPAILGLGSVALIIALEDYSQNSQEV